MNWSQIARIADALSITSSVMTIIGIGGVVTWLQFGDRSLPTRERGWAIAAFGVRSFMALLALLPIGIAWSATFGFLAVVLTGSWRGEAWNADSPFAYGVSYFLSALLFLPISVAAFVAVVTMRLDPVRRLMRHTFRRGNRNGKSAQDTATG
jgi:hypothetical protein